MKSKEQKRIEAEVRQEEYDALDREELRKRVDSRPGRSSRERRRQNL